MASQPRPLNEGQLAKDLPGITAFVTDHKPDTGATTIQQRRAAVWRSIDHDGMGFHGMFPLVAVSTFRSLCPCALRRYSAIVTEVQRLIRRLNSRCP